MYDYFRRLARTGAAYQVGEALAKGVAVVLLPVYTRHLTRADYGTADLLLTLVILVSIVIRLGLVEAFVRFYYEDADPERRDRLARAATGVVLAATTGSPSRRRRRACAEARVSPSQSGRRPSAP